jgi:hypothetical protein
LIRELAVVIDVRETAGRVLVMLLRSCAFGLAPICPKVWATASCLSVVGLFETLSAALGFAMEPGVD